jgi:hypothetical protein
MKDASKQQIVKVPLEVRLTEAELKAAGKAMAEAINKRNRIEGEVETFKAQKKAELAAIEAEVSRNAVLVNSEKEFRLVECSVDYDFDKKGVKTYTRVDTGEIVRTEPITNEERQQMMPGVRDGKSKAAGE